MNCLIPSWNACFQSTVVANFSLKESLASKLLPSSHRKRNKKLLWYQHQAKWLCWWATLFSYSSERKKNFFWELLSFVLQLPCHVGGNGSSGGIDVHTTSPKRKVAMDKDFVKLPHGNNANPILFWKAKASLHFTISSIQELQKRVWVSKSTLLCASKDTLHCWFPLIQLGQKSFIFFGSLPL